MRRKIIISKRLLSFPWSVRDYGLIKFEEEEVEEKNNFNFSLFKSFLYLSCRYLQVRYVLVVKKNERGLWKWLMMVDFMMQLKCVQVDFAVVH